MSDSKNQVLALYDFASKQEYIYKTAKIKEISGASALLDGLYTQFIAWLKENNITIYDNLYDAFDSSHFIDGFYTAGGTEYDGVVLYEGGGNLMVIYKDFDTYKNANKIISKKLLEEYPGLSMISCCVPKTDNFDADRKALYEKNSLNKNRYPASDYVDVTPFTQIDPMTFKPVITKQIETEKEKKKEQSFSADRIAKRKAYKKRMLMKTSTKVLMRLSISTATPWAKK